MDGEPFVMGIKGNEFYKGSSSEWKIKKVKNFYEVKDGEVIACVKYIHEKVVKEVKRRAEVGEYIKIVNASFASTYKNGDILRVKNTQAKTSAFNEGVIVEEHDVFIWTSEYVVLEGYEPPKEEPKYYNGKVVCVKPRSGYTKGKIYEIKDGVIQTDNVGCTQKGFTSLADLNGNSAEFIEVVE